MERQRIGKRKKVQSASAVTRMPIRSVTQDFTKRVPQFLNRGTTVEPQVIGRGCTPCLCERSNSGYIEGFRASVAMNHFIYSFKGVAVLSQSSSNISVRIQEVQEIAKGIPVLLLFIPLRVLSFTTPRCRSSSKCSMSEYGWR